MAVSDIICIAFSKTMKPFVHTTRIIKDAEHIITICPLFATERDYFLSELGEPFHPENIVGLMLKSASNWQALALFATTVMKRYRVRDTATCQNTDRLDNAITLRTPAS